MDVKLKDNHNNSVHKVLIKKMICHFSKFNHNMNLFWMSGRSCDSESGPLGQPEQDHNINLNSLSKSAWTNACLTQGSGLHSGPLEPCPQTVMDRSTAKWAALA
jgi:hypothetical protein